MPNRRLLRPVPQIHVLRTLRQASRARHTRHHVALLRHRRAPRFIPIAEVGPRSPPRLLLLLRPHPWTIRRHVPFLISVEAHGLRAIRLDLSRLPADETYIVPTLGPLPHHPI